MQVMRMPPKWSTEEAPRGAESWPRDSREEQMTTGNESKSKNSEPWLVN